MIGIVILNYETWKLSLRCMESIKTTCSGLSYKIYLVDNASKTKMPKGIRKFLASMGGRACFIQADTNRGYAAGNNIGTAKALDERCSVIIIANNDIVFQKQAVRRMAEVFVRYPKTGIAGPRVLNEMGDIQISRCSRKTGMKEIFMFYTAAKKLFARQLAVYSCLDQEPDQPAEVYHVSGCCFAISAECAREVMPLDEHTVLYGEELILGIRMEQKGWRTRYEPGSVVLHQHGATTARNQPFMYQCISESELYYCANYLQARQWQLWMLYEYRRLLYRLRSIRNVQMRKYWKTFDQETKGKYQDIKKDRKSRKDRKRGI